MAMTRPISEQVKFTQGGAGAAVRTAQDKLRETISVKDFGAVGDGVTDDTEAINACFEHAIATRKTAFIPGGRYRFNGYTNTATSAVRFSLEGEEGNWPTLVMDARPDSPTTYALLFNATRYSDVSGLSLAASIKPNQHKIFLTSVVGLSAGMVIQISSNRLWYNGNRGVYYCGEIHKITDVDAGANTITLEDFTRDVYTVGTDTLVIRAWVPSKVTIRNLIVESPTPASGVGIALQQCDGASIENVKLDTFRGTFFLNNLSWQTTFRNVSVMGDPGLEEAIGYGIEDNGSVGTLVDGLYSKGIRRAYDGGSIAGTSLAAVNRDARVTNFIVDGGGALYPVTALSGYGLGSHGSCEGLIFSNGLVRNCHNGITARGRNTTVSNVVFQGTLDTCVNLYEDGAGLVVENCKYEDFNYPNKFSDLGDIESGSGANVFIQLGSSNSVCFFDIPVVVRGNTCKGLKTSFVYSRMANTSPISNLHVYDNVVEAIPGVGNTFALIGGVSNSTPITRCTFNNNSCTSLNGAWIPFQSTLTLGWHLDAAVKDRSVVVDGQYWVRTVKDTVAVIPNVTAPGRRIHVLANADALGAAFFRITENNATLTAVGTGNIATWVGNASGSTMTGTTGIDGNVTFGLEANGDLYIENRDQSITMVITVFK